ncbi:hypothetical protein L1887_40193 [Cichorium endivia]|nr:hypothetical protein L1887_40193 [Cichorium endivia]
MVFLYGNVMKHERRCIHYDFFLHHITSSSSSSSSLPPQEKVCEPELWIMRSCYDYNICLCVLPSFLTIFKPFNHSYYNHVLLL